MNNFTYLSNLYSIHQAYRENHKLDIFRIVALCKNVQTFYFSDICFSLELVCFVRLAHSTPLKDRFTETHSSQTQIYNLAISDFDYYVLFQIKKKKKRWKWKF